MMGTRIIAVWLWLVPCLAMAQEPVEHRWQVDLGSGKAESTADAYRPTACDANGQDRGRSLFMRFPGRSKVEIDAVLPVAPGSAVLEIEHLASGSGNVPHGSESIISVVINGAAVIEKWNVDSSGFCVDRFSVRKYLKAGLNTIGVRFTGGRTCYWFRRMTLIATFEPGTVIGGKVERIPAAGRADHVVVVSRATHGDPGWRKVVDALVARHRSVVIVYPGAVEDVVEDLQEIFPRYVCFVGRPTQVGRSFVISVHQLMRSLDDDPYTDALWGIVTGVEAADALEMASETEPLLVRRGAAGCGFALDRFEEGVWYSEGKQGVMWEKEPGKKPVEKSCPGDATKALVDELNENRPDLFATSGHASERDWQIGYSFKSGTFRSRAGQLFGVDTGGRRFPVNSPNPKVYLPWGNCLMGHINGRDAMALAWMKSASVRQMYGYVVSTWFGYGGRGNFYFIDLQGQYTLAESFYLNQQALLARLATRYPASLKRSIDDYGIERDRQPRGSRRL